MNDQRGKSKKSHPYIWILIKQIHKCISKNITQPLIFFISFFCKTVKLNILLQRTTMWINHGWKLGFYLSRDWLEKIFDAMHINYSVCSNSLCNLIPNDDEIKNVLRWSANVWVTFVAGCFDATTHLFLLVLHNSSVPLYVLGNHEH